MAIIKHTPDIIATGQQASCLYANAQKMITKIAMPQRIAATWEIILNRGSPGALPASKAPVTPSTVAQ
jgi:hypothetical protein